MRLHTPSIWSSFMFKLHNREPHTSLTLRPTKLNLDSKNLSNSIHTYYVEITVTEIFSEHMLDETCALHIMINFVYYRSNFPRAIFW